MPHVEPAERLQGTKRRLPEEPSIPPKRPRMAMQQTRNHKTVVVIMGTKLPIVMSILQSKNYLPNIMHCQVTKSLSQMGIRDVAQRVAANHSQLAGRLHLFTDNWRVISQDPWVIDCIQGYTIDLAEQPVQSRAPWEINFPKEEADALTVEVQGMLEKQAISRVPREQEAKGFISQLFLVPGGKRPIINLKGLNTSVEKEHFKMESSHMIKDILKPGDWMTKVDLKDAYFMIPLATSQKQLVQFQWHGETYQFNCLPFGLTSAPRVFTKILKVAMTILRSLGLRMITYIDDILIMAKTEHLAKEHTAALIFLLENLGFTPSQA